MTGRILPELDRQMPLVVKYETSRIWGPARELLGVCKTGAAISCALNDACEAGAGFVSYSRSRDYYDKRVNHPLLGFRRVVTGVDQLDAGGWIEHFKQVPGGRGWQSSMVATPELRLVVQELIGSSPLPLAMPFQRVLLRDKDRLPLPIPDTREIDRMVRAIDQVNEALASVDVRSLTGARLSALLVRIFNGDMSRGGRFYAVGSSWQNVPGDVRASVLLDGQETVELDYSTLHPSLLYSEAGEPLPSDCYSIGNWPRQMGKRALLILINARTAQEAYGALARSPVMAEYFPEGQDQAFAVAVRLIADVRSVHRPIERAFHSDAGARLMRQDSRIAGRVLGQLLKKGIVALPVHDSFIVKTKDQAELEAAMIEAAEREGLKSAKLGRKGKGEEITPNAHSLHM
ncbi:MAG: hypothetical protein C0515_00105 [Novosphingobium sp.]|nr:hypothetical protein [Novosphingobium sp.]